MYIHIMCVYKYYIKSGIQRLVNVSEGRVFAHGLTFSCRCR